MSLDTTEILTFWPFAAAGIWSVSQWQTELVLLTRNKRDCFAVLFCVWLLGSVGRFRSSSQQLPWNSSPRGWTVLWYILSPLTTHLLTHHSPLINQARTTNTTTHRPPLVAASLLSPFPRRCCWEEGNFQEISEMKEQLVFKETLWAYQSWVISQNWPQCTILPRWESGSISGKANSISNYLM